MQSRLGGASASQDGAVRAHWGGGMEAGLTALEVDAF